MKGWCCLGYTRLDHPLRSPGATTTRAVCRAVLMAPFRRNPSLAASVPLSLLPHPSLPRCPLSLPPHSSIPRCPCPFLHTHPSLPPIPPSTPIHPSLPLSLPPTPIHPSLSLVPA
ncbi:hypothetical protein Pcinc_006372 [Petrolisthes cinctipes]|uniref:Uncharacterized protein n=1 Tax=Petrolisthes cinctipes TaxID=88211 RepID=A0AAE1GDA2_PETCI|nr:hypothetical protein Pcinc_006372 [Petrolisthes cinctipes]